MANDPVGALTGLLPRLRRFGLALTGSATDTDDLVQNARERALKHAGQLREVNRMDAWLYGIMRTLWIDELRHRRVRRHDDIDAAADVIGDDGQATADGPIFLGTARRAMGRMSADQRTVLTLVCVDGLRRHPKLIESADCCLFVMARPDQAMTVC